MRTRTHLFFDAFRLKHARVGKHECAEGVLAGANVTRVHHGQAVQLAQRLEAILDGTAPARATTQTRVRHAACHVRDVHIHCVYGIITCTVTAVYQLLTY